LNGFSGSRVDPGLARAGADEADEAVGRSQIGKAGERAGAIRNGRAQVGERPDGLAGLDGLSWSRVEAHLARAGADEADKGVGRGQGGKAGKGAGAARDGGVQVGERADGILREYGILGHKVKTETTGAALSQEGGMAGRERRALRKRREHAAAARHGHAAADEAGGTDRCPLELQAVDEAVIVDRRPERLQHGTGRADVEDLPEAADPQGLVGAIERQTAGRGRLAAIQRGRKGKLLAGRLAVRRELLDALAAGKAGILADPQAAAVPGHPHGRKARIEREHDFTITGTDLLDQAGAQVSLPQERAIERQILGKAGRRGDRGDRHRGIGQVPGRDGPVRNPEVKAASGRIDGDAGRFGRGHAAQFRAGPVRVQDRQGRGGVRAQPQRIIKRPGPAKSRKPQRQRQYQFKP